MKVLDQRPSFRVMKILKKKMNKPRNLQNKSSKMYLLKKYILLLCFFSQYFSEEVFEEVVELTN